MPTLPDGSTGWTIPPGLALSADGATTARGVAGVLRPHAGSSELLPMYDAVSREPIAQVTTSVELGAFPAVLTTAPTAAWDFGSVQLPTVSVEATAGSTQALVALEELTRSLQTVESSLDGYVTAEGLAEALSGLGTGGGTGTSTVAGLTDATDFGKTVLRHDDAAALLATLGATAAGRALLQATTVAAQRKTLAVPTLVFHGANANTARPADAELVIWIGTVQPLEKRFPDLTITPS